MAPHARSGRAWRVLLLVLTCAARPTKRTLRSGKKKQLAHGFKHRIHPVHLGVTGYAGYVAIKQINEELYDLGHHHGLALLVASRLCRTLATIESKAMSEIKGIKRMVVAQTTMHVLCAGALIAAGYEVWTDLKPGSHHGMVLLALHEVHELAEEAEGGLYGVLAAELASAPGGFGSVHQPEVVERERLRPLLQDAAR